MEHEAGGESTNEVGVQAIQGLHREGFDLVIDNGAAELAQATEHSFNDHLIAFTDFRLAKADDFQRTGLVLKQESVGRLSLAIRGQLHIHHLSRDDDILMVVLLRMRQKFRDLKQASGSRRRCQAERCGEARDEQKEKRESQGARG